MKSEDYIVFDCDIVYIYKLYLVIPALSRVS